jgi:hypothetical protein
MRMMNCIIRALLLTSLLFFHISPLRAQASPVQTAAIASLPDAPGRDTSSESSSLSTPAQQQAAQGTATISGTVLDSTGALLPGAKVTLSASNGQQLRAVVSDSSSEFSFIDLPAGTYRVTITFEGMGRFVSQDFVLDEGQRHAFGEILLPVGSAKADVEVIVTLQEQAEDQVKVEEKQRAFGIFPNFYVVYDPHFVPLTTKLKYKLAFKAVTDPVTIGAAAFVAGIDQAASNPSYAEGAKGYGQRFGAAYANGATDILIGGAILPSLLHQDPRYFYQGTGTKKSRALHAMESPFLAKGDNGHWQFNYSSVGGDLASASLSNLYYPTRDRGAELVFGNALITTGGRIVNALAQEFILRKLTSGGKN